MEDSTETIILIGFVLKKLIAITAGGVLLVWFVQEFFQVNSEEDNFDDLCF